MASGFNIPSSVYDEFNAGGSPSDGGSGFNWNNLGGGLLSGIGGLVSGIFGQNSYGDESGQIQNAEKQDQQYADQGLGYLQPYNQAGQQAMGNYQSRLDQMSNPTGFTNQIMNSYQTSPMAQYQMQTGQRASDNASAASGNLGTPAQQMSLDRYMQGVTSQDQQRYMGNVMGVNNNYLSGENNLMQTGYGAAGQMNQNRMQLGANLSYLLQSLGMSQGNGNNALGGGIGDLIGGIASGFGF